MVMVDLCIGIALGAEIAIVVVALFCIIRRLFGERA